MRLFALLLLLANAVTVGCVAPQRVDHLLDLQKWEQVCRRLRSSTSRSLRDPVQPAVLTHEDKAVLEGWARRVTSAVVQIRTKVNGLPSDNYLTHNAWEVSIRSGGSGVVIAANGLILTNEHVIRGAAKITVVLPDGSQHPVKQVAVDQQLDLAVLQIEPCDLSPLFLTEPRVDSGTRVVAISSPHLHGKNYIQMGVVTNPAASLQNELDPRRRRIYNNLIESSTQLEPGFSGGPLLDSVGRFVGLNVAVAGQSRSDDQSRAYAIPFTNATANAVSLLVSKLTVPPTR